MARNKYDVDEILEDRFDLNQLKRLGGYIAPYKADDFRHFHHAVGFGAHHADPPVFYESAG